jgi:hypothetical protein
MWKRKPLLLSKLRSSAPGTILVKLSTDGSLNFLQLQAIVVLAGVVECWAREVL